MTLALLILSLILNAALGFGAWRALRKIEVYEEFVASLQAQTSRVLSQMRAVDLRGAFEADDEVGIVFGIMKQLVETLKDYAEPAE